jgi:hypothetical protein
VYEAELTRTQLAALDLAPGKPVRLVVSGLRVFAKGDARP